MENKPVFESFDEFVKFVYEAALNEGTLELDSFKELKTTLADYGLDEKGRKALGAIEEVTIKGSPYTSMSMKYISLCIGELAKPDQTTCSVDCDIQEFEYKNLLDGSVLNSEGKRTPFAQYLATLNIDNIGAYKVPSFNGKTFTRERDNTKFIRGSGPADQKIIIENKSKLNVKEWKYSNPVKNQILNPPDNFLKGPQEAPEEGSKDVAIQYYFYYPVKIVPQGGVEYSTTDVVQFVRKKTETAKKLTPIVIQDNNTLFEVNKSVLLPGGKNAILAALGNVASANSITVTGGASQEGNKSRNEALCKERAKAVADYIKSTTSFKAADVSVSPKSDIQSKASTEDRKSWRRVTLNVDGEYLAPVDKDIKELVYQATEGVNKADSIFIAQAIIQLNSTVIA